MLPGVNTFVTRYVSAGEPSPLAGRYLKPQTIC